MLGPADLVDADLEEFIETARVGLVGDPRAQIRPIVSQSTRTRRVIVVASHLVASHATSDSKSAVNPER